MSRQHYSLLFVFPIIVFFFGICFTEQPFLADDWWWLSLPLRNPHFSWFEPYPFARMPASSLITVATLKAGLWEQWPKVMLTLFFGVHVVAMSFLTKSISGEKNWTLFSVLATLLFICSPNNYEIHLWHILSIHATGALWIALGFIVPQVSLQIVFFYLGLATYDTFIFLLLGMVGARWVVLGKDRAKHFILPSVIAVIINILSKIFLGRLTGVLHIVPFESDLSEIFDHLKVVFKMLGTIHFYKTNWIFTALQASFILFLAFSKPNRSKKTFVLLFLPYLVSIPLVLNQYPAPRAYYGPALLQAMLWSILFSRVLSQKASTRIHRSLKIGGILLCLLYVIQWGFILKVKTENVQVLKDHEFVLLGRSGLCNSTSVLKLPEPNLGIYRDYVLPPFVWGDYYFRFLYQNCNGKVPPFQIEKDNF